MFSRAFHLIAVASSVLLAGLLRAGDLVIEQTMEMNPMPGQPAMNMNQKIWLSKHKLRMETDGAMPGLAGMPTIIRTDLQKIYILNNNTKTYLEMPLNLAAEVPAPTKDNKPVVTRVVAEKETRKIGAWNCRKYTLDAANAPLQTRITLWVTEDIAYDDQLRNTMLAAAAKNPILKNTAEQLQQIKGFPVEQQIEVDSGGMKMSTIMRVKSVKEEKLDEKLFEIPESYTAQEMPH